MQEKSSVLLMIMIVIGRESLWNLHQKTGLTTGTIANDDKLAADFSHLERGQLSASDLKILMMIMQRRWTC
jgi:hypothetical protein